MLFLRWMLRIKRVVDLTGAILGLILAAPVMVVIGFIVRLESPGPALFCQRRTGLKGEEFTVRKFRTMHVGAKHLRNEDGSARVLRADPRLTRFGRILREFGLDELPQLYNVLRGEMSLVGPRPYMVAYTAELSGRARRRLDMRPGMVCLAEVAGRNTLSWARGLELDAYYVDHWSFWLDVSILFRAVPVVLFRRGVYSPEGGK